MKSTRLCPKCSEILVFSDQEDFRICPKCKEIVYDLNKQNTFKIGAE